MSHQEFFQELRKDHEELKTILQQMKSQSSQESGGLLTQLKMEITPHQEAEESQVFDAARSIDANEIDNILRDFQSTKLQIKSDMSSQSAKSEPDNQSQAADANPRSALLADEDLGRMV